MEIAEAGAVAQRPAGLAHPSIVMVRLSVHGTPTKDDSDTVLEKMEAADAEGAEGDAKETSRLLFTDDAPDPCLSAEPRPASPDTAAQQILSESAKARFVEVIYWRDVTLTASVFVAVNVMMILLHTLRVTVLSLLANTMLLAILISAMYHSLAWCHKVVTDRDFSLQRFVAVDLSRVAIALAAPPPAIACQVGARPCRPLAPLAPEPSADFPARLRQATIGRLAGALEGGTNYLLVLAWRAVMLHSLAATAKVFIAAYFLAHLGHTLDAFQILWIVFWLTFTLPYAWALRPRAVDEWLTVARVRTRRAWAACLNQLVRRDPEIDSARTGARGPRVPPRSESGQCPASAPGD